MKSLEEIIKDLPRDKHGKITDKVWANFVGMDNTGNKYTKIEILQSGDIFFYREDGLIDIPIEFSDEDFLLAAKKAHKLNITLNDYIIKALERLCKL